MENTKKDTGFEERLVEYTEKQAISESARCLMCDDAPCIEGCPANVRVSDFLRKIRTGDFLGAAKIIREDNVFGATCARICPTDRLCQEKCSNTKIDTPVDIPGLQRFVCDYQQKTGHKNLEKPVELSYKIAIIGAGPGGLAAAFEFRKLGYQVTIFEATKQAGGMLLSGIPSYRLSRDVINNEINFIVDYGVNIIFNHPIEDLKTLKKDYNAVYISIGLQKEKQVQLPGDDLPGVYYALDFLKRKYIDDNIQLGKSVAVIGGGDVAMDCARTAIRLPEVEDVYIVYRRSAKEMPAQALEIEEAQKEGIIFQNLLVPAAIEGKNKVEKLICKQVKLGEPDKSGRRKPITIENSRVEFTVSNVIFAIGQEPDTDFFENNPDLALNSHNLLDINPDTGETSIPGIYAGGDISGSTTAIESIGAAKKAVSSIHKHLSKGN